MHRRDTMTTPETTKMMPKTSLRSNSTKKRGTFTQAFAGRRTSSAGERMGNIFEHLSQNGYG